MSEDVMGDIFLEAMKQDDANKTKPESRGLLKQGKVVAVSDSDVFLDMGSKSECVVPINEFKQKPVIGDIVDVVLKDMKDGVNIGSRIEAEKLRRVEDIKEAFEKGLPVTGVLEDPIYKDSVPKGFNVELGFNIKAFLPLSQIDTRKDDKLENMKGLSTDFAVIEMKRNNITVSRREFLQKTVKKLYVTFFDTHNIGDVLHGKVERVEEDFVVLTVEGIRAFMHVSDFSWKFLSDMRSVVKVGDEMDVIIIRIEKSKNSVKVGKKQLSPDPWSTVNNKYAVGNIIKGKAVNYRREGVMVEIDDGIEAFLPVEEMSWTEKIRDPKKHIQLGAMLELKISYIEPERRRMNVSLREIQENPWDKAGEVYTYGRKVEGTITSIVDFGLFIKFDDGIEGLMRKEDADWLETNIDLKNRFKKGDKIQAVVLSLDQQKEKLRLGIKQMSDNPYKSFTMNYPKGSVVKGVVKEIQDNGAIISLENDLEGYVHISQISKEKIDKVGDVLKAGDAITALVKQVDSSKNKIELSIKDYSMNEEKIESAKYMADTTPEPGMFTMGSLLKEQFANIKVVEKKNAAKKTKSE